MPEANPAPSKGLLERLGGFFSKKETTINDILAAGRSRFLKDIYGDRVLTPHEEMKECKRLYNYNAFATAGVNTFKDFILGANQNVIADDPKTAAVLNSWLQNIGFFTYLPEMVENYVVTGNAYMEPVRDKQSTQVVKVYSVSNSALIYIQADPQGKVDYYIQELPVNTVVPGAGFHDVTYFEKTPTRIYGIKIPANRLFHFKFGIGDMMLYGRSQLAASVNDAKILRELERDIAVIARYKAIPKKLINIPGANQAKLNQIGEFLSQTDDTDNPLLGEANLNIMDLSYSGKDLNLEPYINYLKRKITSSIAPEYIIHGEDTNRATAKEQRIGYMMRVKSVRDNFSQQVERMILIPQAIALKLDIRGIRFTFSDFDYTSEDEVRQETLAQFGAGLLTLNEARDQLGKDPVENGEVFSWELQGLNPPEPDNPDSDTEGLDSIPPSSRPSVSAREAKKKAKK